MIITKKINEIEVGNIYYCLLSKKPVLVLSIDKDFICSESILIRFWDNGQFVNGRISPNQLIDYDFLTIKDNDQIT